jgi:3-hydroxybutyryl-CoA dehydrogenase
MPVPTTFDTVAVIGNGIIGHGVAQVYAVAGKDAVLVGRNDESLARAVENIRASLADFTRHGLVTEDEAAAALGRIRTTTDLAAAAGAQLVVEAVTHDMDLKRQLFCELDRICAPPAVLASTSGSPASEVHERVGHRERVIAMHFWYPPQLIPVVEVCGSPATGPDVVAWACDAVRACGKKPAVIEREIPGFIGNRLQFALLREAWALWASGAATAESIDACVRLTIGRRLGVTGPIESADIAGLSTMLAFAEGLQPHLDTAPQPPRAIGDVARRGGIYDWEKRDAAALRAARTEELFRWLEVDRGS